jgi:hypothetical protein
MWKVGLYSMLTWGFGPMTRASISVTTAPSLTAGGVDALLMRMLLGSQSVNCAVPELVENGCGDVPFVASWHLVT